MFQGARRKNAREQEQMLISQQEKLKHLMKKIETADDLATDIFEELEKDQNSFDEALNQVVDNIKQIRSGETERFGQEAQLRRELKGLLKSRGGAAEKYGQALEAAVSGEQQLLSIVDQNKHYTEPTRALNQFTKEMVLEASQLVSDIAEMKEMSKQMSVLSLNAAIEAGRMGDPGQKFVSAAEEVRILTEKYQNAAEGLLTRVEAMSKQLEAAREEVGNLTGLLKENNIRITKTAQSLTNGVKTLEQTDISGENEALEKLLADWEAAAKITALHEDHFRRTNDCMEQAGESFIREQQAVEQLKEQWKRIQLEAGKA